uniref:Bm13504 n=1 Tax=Brugia malayi TaxID=6279 RepID=A0A1I9G3J2_BRUMA|nr:Bm13504 [Brugia malayi]
MVMVADEDDNDDRDQKYRHYCRYHSSKGWEDSWVGDTGVLLLEQLHKLISPLHKAYVSSDKLCYAKLITF